MSQNKGLAKWCVAYLYYDTVAVKNNNRAERLLHELTWKKRSWLLKLEPQVFNCEVVACLFVFYGDHSQRCSEDTRQSQAGLGESAGGGWTHRTRTWLKISSTGAGEIAWR